MRDGGLYNYFEAFSYGGQCLGLHMGNKQIADLGDGQGNREWHQAEYETYLPRYHRVRLDDKLVTSKGSRTQMGGARGGPRTGCNDPQTV